MGSDPSSSDPITPGRLSADEAAARLGVKKQTLYAYVSRGRIGREVASDGRSSLFDAAEIDALRGGRGEPRALVSSHLTHVSDEALLLRGEPLVELAAQEFEEVADFLWDGAPDEAWPEWDEVPSAALKVVRALPRSASPIDKIRAALVGLSAVDPMRHELEPRALRSAGRLLITTLVRSQLASVQAQDGLAEALRGALGRNHSRPRLNHRRVDALNAALVLLIDHGLAMSTLGARLAGSVRADPYSVVLAGLGVLGGPLHGAASAHVHAMFEFAEERGAAVAVGEARRRFGVLPGHGHTVYTRADPRSTALFSYLELAFRGDRRLRVVREVREAIEGRTRLAPNIDLALGALTFLDRMDPSSGEVVFAIARSAGWLAHALEEYAEPPLRFRTRARYVGPMNAR